MWGGGGEKGTGAGGALGILMFPVSLYGPSHVKGFRFKLLTGFLEL